MTMFHATADVLDGELEVAVKVKLTINRVPNRRGKIVGIEHGGSAAESFRDGTVTITTK